MIGIVGASGLIGRWLYNDFRNTGEPVLGTYLSRPQSGLVAFDLSCRQFSVFRDCSHLVICAAISRLDVCRNQPHASREVNVEQTLSLIQFAIDNSIGVVFLSSDRVFSGDTGNYVETDACEPNTDYGIHKLTVERFIQENASSGLILRLSKVFSPTLDDGGVYGDTVKQLRERGSVAAAVNQVFNPTDVRLVASTVRQAIKTGISGLYHLADRRVRSRYEFVCEIASSEGFNPRGVVPVDIRSLPVAENKPANTSLNVTKLERELGIVLQ